MLKTELTSLYNAGVCLRSDKQTILIDALEEGYAPYEGSGRELLSREADALLFTHKHPDHFSAAMVLSYLQQHPLCRVFAGSEVTDALGALHVPADRLITLSPLKRADIGGGLGVTALPTRHMGAEYRRKEHYALLLEGEGERILFTGDAAPVYNNFIQEAVFLKHIDLTVAPYVYALYEPAQRVFVRALHSERLALNHIPEPDTDAIRASLRAIPPETRAYRLIVTERNTKMEVD